MNGVTALIVTYNRKELLMRCLDAVAGQSVSPDRILIVDNASTDGTCEMLRERGWLSRPDVEFLGLLENTGGAGGFSAGLRHAVDTGSDWTWMMDDDATPHRDALEHLLELERSPGNIYASLAVSGTSLAWPLVGEHARPNEILYEAAQLPAVLDVRCVPFLGILVSSQLVARIGVPDAAFFIASDDTDYCLRAKRQGAKIVLVSSSRVEHPPSERYYLRLPGRSLYALRLSPWKRYYDVRNRLFLGRNHSGWSSYFSTVPGALLRLVATLWHERDRKRQIWAFVAGITDGVLHRKGRRHQKWGLTQ
jgi:GT2 family glycosyltransferase